MVMAVFCNARLLGPLKGSARRHTEQVYALSGSMELQWRQLFIWESFRFLSHQLTAHRAHFPASGPEFD
jgi:hypothetical protein